MLDILNRQRKVKVDVGALKPQLEAAMLAAGVSRKEVALTLVSDAAMRLLNLDWRGIDAPTDCLSFPAAEGEGGEHAGTVLGDVAISVETALRQGREHAPAGTAGADALGHELVVLFAHSLLHLMGYDHAEDRDARRMRAKERALVQAVTGID